MKIMKMWIFPCGHSWRLEDALDAQPRSAARLRRALQDAEAAGLNQDVQRETTIRWDQDWKIEVMRNMRNICLLFTSMYSI